MSSQPARTYTELNVWHKAMEMVDDFHKLVARLPPEDHMWLGEALRQNSLSIAVNLAQGSAAGHGREFLHHVGLALTALPTIETLTHAARRQNCIDDAYLQNVLNRTHEMNRMLRGLQRSLRRYQSGHGTPQKTHMEQSEPMAAKNPVEHYNPTSDRDDATPSSPPG